MSDEIALVVITGDDVTNQALEYKNQAETAKAEAVEAKDVSQAVKTETELVRDDAQRQATTATAAATQAATDRLAAETAANNANLAAQASADVVYATKALMDADLTNPEGTIALVYSDPDPDANNGIYIKSGATGLGGWIGRYIPPVADGSVSPRKTNFMTEKPDYVFVLTDEQGKVALGIDENEALVLPGYKMQQTHELAWGIADEQGKVALGVNQDGAVLLPGSAQQTTNDYVFVVTDEQGKVALGIDADGNVTVSSDKNIKPPAIGGNFTAEIAHFICYGQSWSVGWDTNGIVSTAVRYDNLMFAGGVCPQYSAISEPYGSFVGLREQSYYAAGYQETPVSGQCEFIKELMASENGLTIDNFGNYKLLGSAPGEGAKTLAELSKGTTYYDRLLAHVTAAHALAQAENKLFAVPAISWIQGGATSDLTDYAARLSQLQIDLDIDIKAISGQTADVKLITWQKFPGGLFTAKQMYEFYVGVNDTNHNVICACPAYFLDYRSDTNIHFTAESSKWIGAYMGLVYKRVVIDQQDWTPVKPQTFTRSGNMLLVKFHVPQPPLKFDIERIAENENYGFNLYSADGTEIPITAISILGTDTLKIVAGNTLNATDYLTYCNKGNSYGRITGKRGNLRDSQGDYMIFDGGGLNLPMHNWCVAFNKILS